VVGAHARGGDNVVNGVSLSSTLGASLAGNALLLLVVMALVGALVTTRRRLNRRGPDLTELEVNLAAARHRVADLVEERGVQIALQPIIDLATGLLVGAEALARFPDGRCADTWFEEASTTGQALDLDRVAFTAACRAASALPEGCYLSVNATPELLLSGNLVATLVEQHVPLDRLVIEVTEHVKIASYGDLKACLLALRERGVRLAIDDTGAGYASFNHVLQLRPDIIKIDRSLIADLTEDPARRSLVTALVLLALDLDATVVAEGVESASELTTLGALGVDYAQGYLLARPSTNRLRWERWADPGRVWDIGQPRIVDVDAPAEHEAHLV
jgi:EAL domain-containing protein (putative c-di-GMP-specific phosphodiesterase class I)